ncbi:hypothetical protein ACQUQU_00400 [Thalassolituus sp. LLYu03]|uniref:hypothetical protein n=1 Tax=Thalassolituus sp. LLYu03 TaxID=3421656 RepID=UPI003D2AAAD7
MPIHATFVINTPPQAQPQTPHLLSVGPSTEALLRLEHSITQANNSAAPDALLNEYLDLVLTCAASAGERHLPALQESWLTRLYMTLRQAALNPQACPHWRQSCFDYLYQAFFVLKHLYTGVPSQRRKLRGLTHEFSTLSRLFTG